MKVYHDAQDCVIMLVVWVFLNGHSVLDPPSSPPHPSLHITHKQTQFLHHSASTDAVGAGDPTHLGEKQSGHYSSPFISLGKIKWNLW